MSDAITAELATIFLDRIERLAHEKANLVAEVKKSRETQAAASIPPMRVMTPALVKVPDDFAVNRIGSIGIDAFEKLEKKVRFLEGAVKDAADLDLKRVKNITDLANDLAKAREFVLDSSKVENLIAGWGVFRSAIAGLSLEEVMFLTKAYSEWLANPLDVLFTLVPEDKVRDCLKNNVTSVPAIVKTGTGKQVSICIPLTRCIDTFIPDGGISSGMIFEILQEYSIRCASHKWRKNSPQELAEKFDCTVDHIEAIICGTSSFTHKRIAARLLRAFNLKFKPRRTRASK